MKERRGEKRRRRRDNADEGRKERMLYRKEKEGEEKTTEENESKGKKSSHVLSEQGVFFTSFSSSIFSSFYFTHCFESIIAFPSLLLFLFLFLLLLLLLFLGSESLIVCQGTIGIERGEGVERALVVLNRSDLKR